jgi:hypothetical protein
MITMTVVLEKVCTCPKRSPFQSGCPDRLSFVLLLCPRERHVPLGYSARDWFHMAEESRTYDPRRVAVPAGGTSKQISSRCYSRYGEY